MQKLIDLLKEIDISKYEQKEYAEIVQEIFDVWYNEVIGKILDRAGWRDVGGSG